MFPRFSICKILLTRVSKDVVDSATLFHLLDNGALVWATFPRMVLRTVGVKEAQSISSISPGAVVAAVAAEE